MPHLYMHMITIFDGLDNPISQDFYDNIIYSIQFHQLLLPLIHYGLIAAGIWLDCLDLLHIPAKLLLNHFSDFSGISTKGII